MKGFYLLILTVCTSAVVFSQQLPSQVQAKRGVFTDRLFLNDRWIDRFSTDLSTADDSSNSVLTTGKAVTDFVQMHSIQSASVTATGNYLHNWNHHPLYIDSIRRLRFDVFEDDDVYPNDNYEHNTLSMGSASTIGDGIKLTSTIYNKLSISDSMMSQLNLSSAGAVLSVANSRNLLFAGPATDGIVFGAYNRNYDDYHYSEVAYTPSAVEIGNRDGNIIFHGLKSVNDTATYKPLGIDATGKIAPINNWPSGAGATRSSFNQTSPVIVSGTANETSIAGSGTGSLVIPASSWKPGKTYRVTIYGTYAVNSGGLVNFNLKLKLGDTTIATTSTQATSISNGQCSATITFTCATTGSAGTVYAFGNFTRGTALFPWNNGISSSGVPKVSTIDMTADQPVNVTAIFADATNTVSTYIFTLEEIN